MIRDEEECKKAVENFGGQFSGNFVSSIYPSGCIAFNDRSGLLNKHELGTGKADAKSICKQGVYQFTHNQSSSNIYISRI